MDSLGGEWMCPVRITAALCPNVVRAASSLVSEAPSGFAQGCRASAARACASEDARSLPGTLSPACPLRLAEAGSTPIASGSRGVAVSSRRLIAFVDSEDGDAKLFDAHFVRLPQAETVWVEGRACRIPA